jgi:hypothetical protein
MIRDQSFCPDRDRARSAARSRRLGLRVSGPFASEEKLAGPGQATGTRVGGALMPAEEFKSRQGDGRPPSLRPWERGLKLSEGRRDLNSWTDSGLVVSRS